MTKQKKTTKEEVREKFLEIMPVSLDKFTKRSYQERRWEVFWTTITLIEKTLRHFLEETEIEEKEESEDASDYRVGLRDGYNQALKDINQKQQQWLKENLPSNSLETKVKNK